MIRVLALLLCFASFALAQRTEQPPTPSTVAAAGAVLGNSSLTTASAVPRVSAAGTINESKLSCTAGNPGTCTLYDTTAVAGVSTAVVRAGAGQASTALSRWLANNGTTLLASVNADGGITAEPLGSVPAWKKYSVAKIANSVSGCSSFDVAAPVYTPIGAPALNDSSSGGAYSTTAVHTYTAEIDLAAATDTFRWRKDAGTWTNGVAMTGAPQTLADGVTIAWTATTGHTLGDSWAITATDLGCFQVNTGTPVAAEGDLSQDIVLFQLPANGFVDAVRLKTSTAFTGAATAAATLGTATDTAFFVAAGYDLAAVVADTNFAPAAGVPANAGSTTAAAVNIVLNITTTVNNLTALATGSAVDVWIKYAVLP